MTTNFFFFEIRSVMRTKQKKLHEKLDKANPQQPLFAMQKAVDLLQVNHIAFLFIIVDALFASLSIRIF